MDFSVFLLSHLCLLVGPAYAAGSGAAQAERVVIEEVAPGSAGERAGLQPGDDLAAWSDERGGSGVLRTPFDLADVKVEQAPRGVIVLQGSRGREEKSGRVLPGVWGIEARPDLEPGLLSLYEQGRQRIASGDLDGGAALWRSVLDSLQAAPASSSWLESRLAKAYSAAGRWSEADAAWEQAARRVEPHHASGAAQILDAWARTLNQRNAHDRAEACHRRALELLPKESLAAARHLSALGTLVRRNDPAAGEALLKQAYAIREKLAPDSLDFAASLTDLGIVAARRSESVAAGDLFAKALELQQRLAPGSQEEASTLINLATIAHAKGDLDAAEDLFRRAIERYERLNPDDPELARALSRLGLSEMDRGDLALSEKHLRRALAIREKLMPESLLVASSFQNLGFVAERRGDLVAAEEHHRRALAIREKIAPDSVDMAESLANLATLERRKGNLAKADEDLRRALEIQERKSSPESANAINIRINRAGVAMNRGDLALAEELYSRALALLESRSQMGPDASDCLEGLGMIALERGDLVKAEAFFQRGLGIREKLEPGSTGVAMLLNGLGRVHLRGGRLAMAADSFCRATKAIDQQRTRLGGPMEERSSFGGTTAEYYRDCLAALVDRGQAQEAFRVLEQGRARSFLDLLAERDLRWTANLPPELARDRKQVNAEYDRTQAALARLSPAGNQAEAEAEVDRLQVRLRELRVKQEEIVAKIRQASPRDAALHEPQPLDLAAARNALDPGTLLLAYSIGTERSFLFVVDPAGPLEVFPLPVGDKALRQRVESFRNLLQLKVFDDPEALPREARELYDLLLRPADPRIAAAARILVSPDGPLHTLPVAALIRDGRFLAEQKPVHTVISATVYAELQRSRREPQSADRMEIAAFGDPRYPPLGQPSAAQTDVRAAVQRGLKLTPLPATREEVRGIAALYSETQTFLGTEATEERAKSIGTGARAVHFACHGLLDERFPLNSALALSIPDRPAEGQDNGLLQAWEIFESVRLDADLVTLSACDSAMGSEMGGEGLLGLTRAFQYAGARSVLASLWSVSDASTADLMKHFYSHLRAGRSKDEALQAAQVEMIRSPRFSHPFHWAAFQVAGDWK
ncbi:MAG TPA: CHAT domain-containing protein [Thermoanaerobaculia bacterium]|nr:CHAT domain-containing protein [Thermoanaerobaculia bacterium]